VCFGGDVVMTPEACLPELVPVVPLVSSVLDMAGN
jgi:hypothetical protein